MQPIRTFILSSLSRNAVHYGKRVGGRTVGNLDGLPLSERIYIELGPYWLSSF